MGTRKVRTRDRKRQMPRLTKQVRIEISILSERIRVTRSLNMSENGFPSLEQYRIHSLPNGLHYIPNFLTPQEEQSLLDKVPPQNLHLLT